MNSSLQTRVSRLLLVGLVPELLPAKVIPLPQAAIDTQRNAQQDDCNRFVIN